MVTELAQDMSEMFKVGLYATGSVYIFSSPSRRDLTQSYLFITKSTRSRQQQLSQIIP